MGCGEWLAARASAGRSLRGMWGATLLGAAALDFAAAHPPPPPAVWPFGRSFDRAWRGLYSWRSSSFRIRIMVFTPRSRFSIEMRSFGPWMPWCRGVEPAGDEAVGDEAELAEVVGVVKPAITRGTTSAGRSLRAATRGDGAEQIGVDGGGARSRRRAATRARGRGSASAARIGSAKSSQRSPGSRRASISARASRGDHVRAAAALEHGDRERVAHQRRVGRARRGSARGRPDRSASASARLA